MTAEIFREYKKSDKPCNPVVIDARKTIYDSEGVIDPQLLMAAMERVAGADEQYYELMLGDSFSLEKLVNDWKNWELNQEEEQVLFEYYMSQETSDQEKERIAHILICSHLRLLKMKAKVLLSFGIPFDDSMQACIVGFFRAVKEFDPDRGYRLSSYANYLIKDELTELRNREIDGIGSKRFAVTYLESMPDWTNLIGDDSQLEENQEQSLTIADITEFIHLSQVGGDLPIGVKALSQREIKILSLRFGLGENNPQSLQEVGDLLGVSREAIRLAQNKALDKCKAYLNSGTSKL